MPKSSASDAERIYRFVDRNVDVAVSAIAPIGITAIAVGVDDEETGDALYVDDALVVGSNTFTFG